MRPTTPLCVLTFLFYALVAPLDATDVLSHHSDLASTGQNLTETLITPANLTVATFQKRFATTLDNSAVQAQPLYKAGVNIAAGPNQGTHDMALVATYNGTLYGIDVNDGTKLWETPLPDHGLPNQTLALTSFGLLSTPVIDPATNTMFVAYTNWQQLNGEPEDSLHAVIMLYAVDIRDGSILRTTVIADTYRESIALGWIFRTDPDPAAPQDPFVFGTGDGAITVNGTSRVYLNAFRQIIRCGLTLLNGEVYVTIASFSDEPPYHGWIVRYNAATLALTGVFNATPNGDGAGIWQSGGILSVDPDGYIYCITGNGTFDGDVGPLGETIGLNPQGFPVNANYGDCYLKLGQDATSTQASQNPNGWGLKVVDYFAPYNNQVLSAADADLGGGGPTILPDSVGNAMHPHLLVGAGKEGKIYLVDRDNMGKFDPATDHVVQSIGGALFGCHSTPAYHNGRIYYVDAYYGGTAKAFEIADAQLSGPTSVSPDYFGYPGGTPMISANGAANAIVWHVDRNTRQLRAYNAADYGNEIWNSAMAGSRDALVAALATFAIPVVADGRVLVATTKALVVYGPPAAATAAPAAPTDLVATTTSGAEITLTWTDTANNEATHHIEQSADGVSFAEVGVTGVNVSTYVATGLSGGTAYYFRVRAENAIGTSAYSNVATAFTASQSPPINFASGFQSSTGLLQYNGSAAIVNSRARLTDAETHQQGGAVWTVTPQDIDDFSTQFTFQVGTPAFGEGFTFCIQNAGINSVASGLGTLGYKGIGSSVAVKFDFSSSTSTTGLYVNGVEPADGPSEMSLASAGINFRSGNIFKVVLTYDGTTLTETITDLVTNATATTSFIVDIPGTIGATTAHVGFTGGTGGNSVEGLGFGRAIQDLLSWSYFHLPTGPPSAPGSLTAVPASGTQVNLSWVDAADNEDGFIIERKIGVGGTYAQVGEVGANATSRTDGGLTPNTTYFYRVAATNVLGPSGFSNVFEITTPIAPPPAGNFRTTAVTANSVAIAWDLAPHATGYGVLRQSSTEANYTRLASTAPDATQTMPPNATSYVDTTVQPGVMYSYLIQAFNIAGVSTSQLTVTTPTKVSISAAGGPVRETLPATATFTVSRLGGTTDPLTVYYQLRSGANQAAYGTRYSLSPAPNSVVIPAGAAPAAITLTPAADLAVLGPQDATLDLVVGAGYELNTAASASVEILDAPLAAPSGLSGTGGSGPRVNLSWTDNSNNESGFVIQRKTSAGGTFAQIGTAAVNATTYQDTALIPGTGVYYYRVLSVNAVASQPSNETVVTVDTVAPALTMPGTQTAEATSAAGAVASYPAPTANEPVTFSYSKASGTLFALGNTTVNVTATDLAGNVATGSFIVRVVDTTAPSISVPGPVSAAATSAAGANVSYPAATATDLVTASPTISYSKASGSLFPLGATTVLVTATDAANNSATASFVVTVSDGTAPVITHVPAAVVLVGDLNNLALVPDLTAEVGATDNVGVTGITQSPLAGTSIGLGAHTVTCTVRDAAGNTATCQSTVTVNPDVVTPGRYQVTLSDANGAQAALQVKRTSGGLISGFVRLANAQRARLPGSSAPPTGPFDLTLSDGSTLTLAFDFDDHLTATLTNTLGTSTGTGTVADARAPVALPGKYTAVLDPRSAAPGWLSVVVSSTGAVRTAGKLPDGSSILASQGSLLNRQGRVPLFLIGKKTSFPLLAGDFQFANLPQSDLAGALTLRAAGVPLAVAGLGAKFVSVGHGLTPGVYALRIDGLPDTSVTLAANNSAAIQSPVVSFKSGGGVGRPATGLFAISFRPPGTTALIKGTGVFQQKLGTGSGLFILGGNVGRITVGP